MDFENKIINGEFATRYIVSWFDAKYGGIKYRDFIKWLESIGVAENEAIYIANLGTNGKLELEESAKRFIKNR